MLGHVRLHEAPARLLGAARTTRHLMEELERPLGRPRIGAAESQIAVDDADQSEPREVVPLGDDLRADDDVGLSLGHGVDDLAQLGDRRRQIARQDGETRIRKALGHLLGDALDARAAGHERVRITALRTMLGLL